MADEVDSKSIGSDTVRVQVPQPALLGRGESLKNNMVCVIFKAFSFCNIIKSLPVFILVSFLTKSKHYNKIPLSFRYSSTFSIV